MHSGGGNVADLHSAAQRRANLTLILSAVDGDHLAHIIQVWRMPDGVYEVP